MTYETAHELASPDGTVEMQVGLVDGRPHYDLRYDGTRVLEPSPLGLVFEAGPLVGGFEVVGAERATVDETWEPVWGRYEEIRDHHEELRVDLRRSGSPSRLGLTVRAYDDGIAVRYHVPEQEGLDRFALTDERTAYRLAGDYTAWWTEGDYDSYEFLYEETPASELPRVHTPLTMDAGDCYLSLHEAALREYAAATLSGPAAEEAGSAGDGTVDAGGPTLETTLTPLPSGAKVEAATPHRSPWRTIQLGADPGDLVESSLVVNCNDPPADDPAEAGGPAAADWEWVDPGTYVGIWWEMHVGKSTWAPGPDVGATTENAKRYVDFAADHDVPAVLVEGWNEGWEGGWDDQEFTTPTEYYDLEAVVAYADERGVGVVAHCETGADFLDFEAQLDEAFALYEDLGMPAVKTGYVGSMPEGHTHHDQRLVAHHRRVVETAAEHGLLVDAHEAVKPTGERRTYPNFVTRECVRGMEYNAWSDGNPPRHTVVLPFTRMLAGPLDYTPGIFDVEFPEYEHHPGDPGDNRVYTTRARQLALMVVLFSGLQMAADLPENYEGEEEFEFVEALPADWDDLAVPNASVGEYVTVARRHGEEWFLGSGTDDRARDLEIPLDFLDEGTYEATVYADGPDADVEANPTDVAVERRTVTADESLTASMVGGGGHAVHLVPE